MKEISGPTIDLPPMEQTEQKFSGRNRLYIGNLTNDVTEQEILDIFNSYGETAELFLNKDKNFAFIRIVRIMRICHYFNLSEILSPFYATL